MEELKIVMEAIAQLGQAGKEAFVWYVALKYGAGLLQSMMVLVAVITIPYMVLRAIRQANSRNSVLAEIGKDAGVDYWYWADHDVPGHSAGDVLRAVKERSK